MRPVNNFSVIFPYDLNHSQDSSVICFLFVAGLGVLGLSFESPPLDIEPPPPVEPESKMRLSGNKSVMHIAGGAYCFLLLCFIWETLFFI